jgi:hypothetical protein
MDSGPSDAEPLDAVAPDSRALPFCQQKNLAPFCDDFESGSLNPVWQMNLGTVPKVVVLANNHVAKSFLVDSAAPPAELSIKDIRFTSVEFDFMYESAGGQTKRVAQVLGGANCFANLLVQNGKLLLSPEPASHAFTAMPSQWAHIVITFEATRIAVRVGTDTAYAPVTACAASREFRVGFAIGDNQSATAYVDNVLAL